MYYYWGFGLTIESEIELPDLELLSQPPLNIALTIHYGDVTAPHPHPDLFWGHHAAVSPRLYYLNVTNVAAYQAIGGKHITVKCQSASNNTLIARLLISRVIPVVMYQRSHILLHCSGIKLATGGVALVCGDSGAGKSTTTTALLQQGFDFFVDDVGIVQTDSDNTCSITSAGPAAKLWQQSFDLLNLTEQPSQLNRVNPVMDKYLLKHQASSQHAQAIKVVFCLSKSKQITQPQLTLANPLQAFELLSHNTFGNELIKPMELSKVHFACMANIAKQARVYSVTRPENGNSITQLIDMLITQL
jgi:hypothetical protein